jgi:hypothetical protein
MIKKLTLMGILFFIASTFLFCIDEEQKNPQPDLSDARARIRPKADAGNDVTIALPTNASKLDGSNSKDSLGVIKSYQWSNVSGPSNFVINNPTKALTDVTSLVEGVYTFRLTVTNDKNAKSYDDVVVTVNKGTAITTTTLTDALYFSGNMDNVTITALDGKEPVFNGWSELKSHPFVEGLKMLGKSPFARQEIAKDPINTTRNAFYAQIIDDDANTSGTSRAQTSLHFKDGVNLEVYHTSHRIYLDPDIAFMTNYSSKISWFIIFEIWNKHVDGWDGDVAGSARWDLLINKETGSGQPLYWRIKSETMQPASAEYNNIWNYTNKAVPVPIGKWVTLDLYMKRGEGTAGRFTVKITPDGGATTVLFDVNNTTIYPGHPEIPLYSFQPFKLYLDDAYLDYMRANGKKISAYYNDFKWYKN